MLQIINDVLDLSKAEAGKLTLDEDVFDVRDIVRSVSQLTRVRMHEQGLTESIDLPPDLPLLYGDERKTMQMLLNLVTNAIKFSPTGGRVEICCRVDPLHGLSITVADSGIGIAANDLGRVVEPFEQVDTSLSRRYEGTGLGLPLVKMMIELHGGTLDLQSGVGVGTTAKIAFPPGRVVAHQPKLSPSSIAIRCGGVIAMANDEIRSEVDPKVRLDLAQPAEHILAHCGEGNDDPLVLTGRWIGFDGER